MLEKIKNFLKSLYVDNNNVKDCGYLPDERPPLIKLLLYALQQVIVMFPATVTVALITRFDIGVTIFASGLATLCFILITGRKIPLYYGSSFSYISAIIGLAAQQGLEIGSVEAIRTAQFGIVMSGLVSIVAGLIVKRFGRESIEKVLPPTVTGSIAMVIGLTLASNAMQDAVSVPAGAPSNAQNLAWIISLVTLLSTIIFSVKLKGFLGQLTLLLGPICGVITTFAIKLITGVDFFRTLGMNADNVFSIPNFTTPIPTWTAILAIMPIAIATIPESTAHVFQLDVYVNDLAKKKGSNKKYNIGDMLGLNLIGDGIGDIVSGFVGGPAGTNYGENISAMSISRVFSIPVLICASVIAMIIACFTPLINAIYAIPTPVIGGLEIFLFGCIAAQGIAIMIERNVDMFESKNIAIVSTIMVIAIGGQYAFNGSIPFFGAQLPCIACAAIFGILLNLLFNRDGGKVE